MASTPPPWLVLANKLKQYPVEGGIADASGAGAFTALFAERPFYGSRADGSPDDFYASGARLVCVAQSSPIATQLDHDARFENLDSALRLPKTKGPDPDLKVYRVVPAQ